MKERLPPLQGMYYFYIAAEKGSFKAAAEHLFVTAAAISQQIRQLEEWLECELFERQHRKVKLTNEGETLYYAAKKGFFELQDGVRKLNQDPEPDRLSISTHPTFAQHWLIPRLKSFREQNPELSLLVDPKNELVNFQDGLIDICIRYGHGDYPELEAVKLMDEILYPVCHPSYQEEKGIWKTEDLVKADLIEDVWPDMTWSLWFEELEQNESQVSLKYDGSQFVMEGALAAQGVALVKHSLAYRYLQEGKLVRIGEQAAKSRYSYFLCAPAGYFRRDKIRAFRKWIESEISTFLAKEQDGLNLINEPDDKELKLNGC
ncbi:LysR substrate-binding domain-containing protein [Vibrio hannami]|uniref:LysR substrate-binding domain-containing protein n=1 Tax=Vibrio hannami TaxID=2717094 RepID=UPI00240EE065|nr:LysR substrate-binding domain-containing protein [Vibrio hannami]MDG3085904.1 LysR substrate-binding domain-containing protein [Vibrio hannami]